MFEDALPKEVPSSRNHTELCNFDSGLLVFDERQQAPYDAEVRLMVAAEQSEMHSVYDCLQTVWNQTGIYVGMDWSDVLDLATQTKLHELTTESNKTGIGKAVVAEGRAEGSGPFAEHVRGRVMDLKGLGYGGGVFLKASFIRANETILLGFDSFVTEALADRQHVLATFTEGDTAEHVIIIAFKASEDHDQSTSKSASTP